MLALVLVADAAMRKKTTKYSQGCFYALLTETDGGVGGTSHLRRGDATR